jgi:hypothetical protein
MQFTPQQLAGAGRYSHKTRIGNWCEDLAIEQVKLQDFLDNKKKGTLLTMQAGIRAQKSLQPVPVTFSTDGCLRFGDSIKLESRSTNGDLSCNTNEKLSYTDEIYAVSVCGSNSRTKSVTPGCARNTFVIEKYPKYDYPDNILRTGQPFLLGCNPSLRTDDESGMLRPLLYLSSKIVDTNNFAKMSNHQQVSLLGGDIKYSMVWETLGVADRRYQRSGVPVTANTPFILRHKATGTPLACDPAYPQTTDFGREFEVACHQYVKKGKTLNLISEKRGLSTGDTRQRGELMHNHWMFVTSQNEADGKDTRQFVRITSAVIIDNIRKAIEAKGADSYAGLKRAFDIIDDRGNGFLDTQEFRYALSDYGIHLRDEEFNIVQKHFDSNGDGVISFGEFMNAIERQSVDESKK